MTDIIRLRDRDELVRPPSEQKKVILLIDGSDSMNALKKRFASEGALEFASGALRKKYSVGAVGFASTARLICKPTTDLGRIRKACQCFPVRGGTFIGAGLSAAQNLDLDSGDVIVVITDGQCGQPTETLSLAAGLKANGIEILAIGTDDADQAFLKQLASRADLGLKVHVDQLRATIRDASRLLPGPSTSATIRDGLVRLKDK